MLLARPLLAALLIATPALAVAQTDPPRRPTAAVATANDRVAAEAAARQGAIAAGNDASRMQDYAAYDAALRRNHRMVRRDRRMYRRQRLAYADAMAAWRRQVRDCHHGNRAACRAPTPDPAAYF